jgi:hypothetical protein
MNKRVLDIASLSLSDEHLAIALKCLNKGVLRATKPKTDDGYAAYVWRNICFSVSQNPKHWCMPVCADMDMKEVYKDRRNKCKELDILVNNIINLYPKNEWYGVTRWARAMGQ